MQTGGPLRHQTVHTARILHVIPYFRPAFGFGGPAFSSDIVTQALAQRGYRVGVWTTDVANPFGARVSTSSESLNGVQVSRYHYTSRALYQFSNLLLSPGMVLDAATIDASSPDLVHLHDFRSMQAVAAYVLCKRRHIPLVLQPHGTLARIGGKERLKTLYDVILGSKLARQATRVLVLSTSEANDCKSLGIDEGKVVIIPNGVPIPSEQDIRQRGRFRAIHGIELDAFLVLYLGRIRESKGVLTLIDAFEDVSRTHTEAVLVVCGADDGAESELRRRAARGKLKVIFPGLVTGQQKTEVFVDSDVFCLPSSFETQSVALLEAASFGLPIVAGTHNVPAEFLREQAGLFGSVDRASLQEAISHLAESETTRREMGRRARSTVGKYFRIDDMLDALDRLYHEVLHNG